MEINNFSDFCTGLSTSGFSMGGGNDKGIFALIPYNWENQQFIDSPVKWHTGEEDTDPWEWRMRVLEQRDDIAYSKFFFRTSGYIYKDWYPYFYAVRRGGMGFDEIFKTGAISRECKRIYDVVREAGSAPLHELKRLGGFGKEESKSFDRALVDLQMGMFITMCGRTQKLNKYGEGYGWNVTVFSTVEDFWQGRGFSLPEIDPADAYDRIKTQVLVLNPEAKARNIDKFIKG